MERLILIFLVIQGTERLFVYAIVCLFVCLFLANCEVIFYNIIRVLCQQKPAQSLLLIDVAKYDVL